MAMTPEERKSFMEHHTKMWGGKKKVEAANKKREAREGKHALKKSGLMKKGMITEKGLKHSKDDLVKAHAHMKKHGG